MCAPALRAQEGSALGGQIDAVEQYTEIDADIYGDLYAYSETTLGYNEGRDYFAGVATELDVYMDGALLYWDPETGGSDDVYAEYYGTVPPGHTYAADGLAYVCENSDWGDSNGCSEQNGFSGYVYEGDIYVSIDVPPGSPSIASINPTGGNIGDQSQYLTIYGENLVGTGGQYPSLAFQNTQGVSSGDGVSFQVQSASDDGSVVNATYSISSSAVPDFGGISLTTNVGEDAADFSVGYPSATISSVTPDTWNAGDPPFQLTVTGNNFGTAPTLSIGAPYVTYTTPVLQSAGVITTTVTVDSNAPSESAPITVFPSYTQSGGGNSFTCGMCSNGNSDGSTISQAQVLAAPSCPTSVTLSQIYEQPLSLDYPGTLTGVGILSLMQLGPANGNFTMDTFTETVTPTGNTCPANIQQYTSFPIVTDANSTHFLINTQAIWERPSPYPPVPNAFYDSHRLKLAFNILGATTVNYCQATATQVYKCNGQPIGEFFLTNQYSSGLISGQPVTYVDVTKQ